MIRSTYTSQFTVPISSMYLFNCTYRWRYSLLQDVWFWQEWNYELWRYAYIIWKFSNSPYYYDAEYCNLDPLIYGHMGLLIWSNLYFSEFIALNKFLLKVKTFITQIHFSVQYTDACNVGNMWLHQCFLSTISFYWCSLIDACMRIPTTYMCLWWDFPSSL